METKTFSVRGMTCGACGKRVETALRGLAGVEQAAVDFAGGAAVITYDPSRITAPEMAAHIGDMGYGLSEKAAGTRAGAVIGALLLIAGLGALAHAAGISTLTAAFPLAEPGAAPHLLFIVGLITSAHCVAMCGGINLSQTLRDAPSGSAGFRTFVPGILYNAGRVVSYTVTGALAGGLGQAVRVSGASQGVIQMAAGIFMLCMGLTMLGLLPIARRIGAGIGAALTRVFPSKSAGVFTGKSPLLIGLLNGLMPCGPLQAMQVYALSTGNPVSGGLAMLIFSLGTLPLMFGLSAISSFLTNRFASGGRLMARITKAGAVLVGVMGVTMLLNGWNLTGFSLSALFPTPAATGAAGAADGGTAGAARQLGADGVQVVNSVLGPGRYPSITVQAGIPVRWVIDAPTGSINGCNNRMFIRHYRIEHRFTPGENVIEFMPEKAGKVPYSCWMGMIRGTITVIPQAEDGLAAAPGVAPEEGTGDAPDLTGVPINVETVAVARTAEGGGYQEAAISLTDDGFAPAVVVVARGVPARWVIRKDSLDPGNAALAVPAYQVEAPLADGENVVQFIPEGDFVFRTVDLVFYGYVKVVDDLERVDVEAVKAEIAPDN
jgi:sulfite exporter TauE/SafE/plastocyanin domain-containing protein